MANSADFKPGFNGSEGSYVPDMLLAGDKDIHTDGVIVASGQTIVRGALLGIVTATGKAILSLSGASDGSEVPVCIAGEDVDASGGDTNSWAYFAGEFNENQMTFGTGHTADSVRAGLRDKSIYLHNPIVAE